MQLPVDVLIVSDSPIIGLGLKRLLDPWPAADDRRLTTALAPAEECTARDPGGLLIALQTWEQMASRLPGLSRQYPRCPWLLLADPRVAGMFLSHLRGRACTLVPLDASAESLRHALYAVAGGRRSCLAADLLARFARGVRPEARRGQHPSMMEIQCGCAVSMGLSNRRIAEVLYLGEPTVKSHLHHLHQKLGVTNRTELGVFFQRALAPIPSRSAPKSGVAALAPGAAVLDAPGAWAAPARRQSGTGARAVLSAVLSASGADPAASAMATGT